MVKIIGVTGEPGAGKTTVANMIKEQLPDAEHIEMSAIADYLSYTMEKLNQSKRPTFHKSINMKIDNYAEDNRFVVVSGLRTKSDYVELIGEEGMLVYVEAPSEKRLERLQRRGRSDKIDMDYLNERDLEEYNMGVLELRKYSDEFINNFHSLKGLRANVENKIVERNL